jgi:hypothetical protein
MVLRRSPPFHKNPSPIFGMYRLAPVAAQRLFQRQPGYFVISGVGINAVSANIRNENPQRRCVADGAKTRLAGAGFLVLRSIR